MQLNTVRLYPSRNGLQIEQLCRLVVGVQCGGRNSGAFWLFVAISESDGQCPITPAILGY